MVHVVVVERPFRRMSLDGISRAVLDVASGYMRKNTPWIRRLSCRHRARQHSAVADILAWGNSERAPKSADQMALVNEPNV